MKQVTDGVFQLESTRGSYAGQSECHRADRHLATRQGERYDSRVGPRGMAPNAYFDYSL